MPNGPPHVIRIRCNHNHLQTKVTINLHTAMMGNGDVHTCIHNLLAIGYIQYVPKHRISDGGLYINADMPSNESGPPLPPFPAHITHLKLT
jgi:hypothetical protein